MPTEGVGPLLASLLLLREGWDGGSARPPDEDACLRAQRYLGICGVGLPSVSATPRGGVSVTQRLRGRVFYAEFLNSGGNDCMLSGRSGLPVWKCRLTVEAMARECRSHLLGE